MAMLAARGDKERASSKSVMDDRERLRRVNAHKHASRQSWDIVERFQNYLETRLIRFGPAHRSKPGSHGDGRAALQPQAALRARLSAWRRVKLSSWPQHLQVDAAVGLGMPGAEWISALAAGLSSAAKPRRVAQPGRIAGMAADQLGASLAHRRNTRARRSRTASRR